MQEEELLNLSLDVLDSFISLEYRFETLGFPDLYKRLNELVPADPIHFENFRRDVLILCEMVSAAICHKINWDFLRKAVYDKTTSDTQWLTPKNLSNISENTVLMLLLNYKNTERIQAHERSTILRNLGKELLEFPKGVESIFLTHQKMSLKQVKQSLIL